MRARERAGLAVALGCLLLIVFRVLSPDFYDGYDWIALTLTVLAAIGLILPTLLPETECASAAPADPEPVSLAWEGLQIRIDALGWHKPEGGLYDGLIRLSASNAYAAVCGAYATLILVLEQAGGASAPGDAVDALAHKQALSATEADALRSLLDMLETFSQIGAHQADEACARALLGMALCATGRAETLIP